MNKATDFLFGKPEPPRPAEPGQTPIFDFSGFEAGLGEAPQWRELTEEEKELQKIQLDRIRRATDLEKAVFAALEKKYGRPFADKFADDVFEQDAWNKELFGESKAALARAQAARDLYRQRVGHTAEDQAAIEASRQVELGDLAHPELLKRLRRQFEVGDLTYPEYKKRLSRQIEVGDEAYPRYQKAMRGEYANPAIEADLTRQRQELEDRMANQYGAGWSATEQGRRAERSFNESALGQREAGRHMELAEMGPLALPSMGGAESMNLDPGQFAGSERGGLVGSAGPPGSPSAVSGGLMPFFTRPTEGIQPFMNYLATDRANASNFDRNVWDRRFQGGLMAAMLPYESYYRRLGQYEQNQFQAERDSSQRAYDFWNTWHQSGMTAAGAAV